MAGPYAHCLVSEKAGGVFNDPLYIRYSPFGKKEYRPYLFLGSVSPDYPYIGRELSNIDTNFNWGDEFHKHHNGDIVKAGIKLLRSEADQSSRDFIKKAAWLMGYYSHIITDMIVHAMVYNIVGRYEENGDDHMECEMVQDSMLFNDLKKKELTGSDFLSIINKCSYSTHELEDPMGPGRYEDSREIYLDKPLKEFWLRILRQTCAEGYSADEPDLDAWHRTYSDGMRLAKGFLSRTGSRMFYRKTDKIAASKKDKYYTGMAIPGKQGAWNYRKEVFEFAVREVSKGWRNFLGALSDQDAYRKFNRMVVNSDLDTGTIDGVDFVHWPGAKTTDRPA